MLRESLPLHIEGSGKETSVLSDVPTCEQQVIGELGRLCSVQCKVCKVCKDVQGMYKADNLTWVSSSWLLGRLRKQAGHCEGLAVRKSFRCEEMWGA